MDKAEIRVTGAMKKNAINGTHERADVATAIADAREMAKRDPFARIVVWFEANSGEMLPHTTVQESL